MVFLMSYLVDKCPVQLLLKCTDSVCLPIVYACGMCSTHCVGDLMQLLMWRVFNFAKKTPHLNTNVCALGFIL